MPTCEICGRNAPILVRVLIEGAKVSVCRKCSKLGKPIKITATSKLKPLNQPVPKATIQTPKPQKPPKTPSIDIEKSIESYSLVKNYGLLVKNARERMGLSHEELGVKLGEKASVIRKIEQGKLKPDNVLAKKLEHFLKIKLLMPSTEIKIATAPKVEDRQGLTIGDLLKKSGGET
ncbi:TIGR00270 family protein [Candidatus Bathyarchaeota archaeon]|nr:TIGR00270 family protein [Candidatus Bathyarchaeota archaeon]MBS7613703.1 TIGR00270 family protein [Candidatus Bathyarchaeota archaeon]MBS7618122.1 TIGR00270 family protein [Candidatus Bathyarchaeota archaeon]